MINNTVIHLLIEHFYLVRDSDIENKSIYIIKGYNQGDICTNCFDFFKDTFYYLSIGCCDKCGNMSNATLSDADSKGIYINIREGLISPIEVYKDNSIYVILALIWGFNLKHIPESMIKKFLLDLYPNIPIEVF